MYKLIKSPEDHRWGWRRKSGRVWRSWCTVQPRPNAFRGRPAFRNRTGERVPIPDSKSGRTRRRSIVPEWIRRLGWSFPLGGPPIGGGRRRCCPAGCCSLRTPSSRSPWFSQSEFEKTDLKRFVITKKNSAILWNIVLILNKNLPGNFITLFSNQSYLNRYCFFFFTKLQLQW